MIPFLVKKLVIASFLVIFLGKILARNERYLIHRTVLDGADKFHFSWGPGEHNDLVFKIEVMTLGYVSIGLSPNGGMAESDVVTGWVQNNKVYLQDRYAEGTFMPRKDSSQDWILLSGSENDTHTTLLFKRKLETCDMDDVTIDSSTMRVIYAYSDEDPSDEDSIPYHQMNRGSKSIILLQSETKSKIVNMEETSYWDVLSLNYTLTADKTTMYWCTLFKGPELPKKHHIVMVEPLIEKGHEGYVHHIVLYECPGAAPEDFDEHIHKGHQCYSPNMPPPMMKCEGVFAAWGVGGENLVFPDHVGLPLDPTPVKYYMLQMHYDNPLGHDGIVDNSGFRLHYTPNLRQYDAGSLMLGADVGPKVIIPPGRQNYVITGHTNPDCLGPAMPPDGIKIIGIFQHSHLLGRRIITRHFRNGIELEPLAADTNYDFNYQEYIYLSKEREFLPEDQITVECTFDSSERRTPTFGGLSTRQEMCLAFVLYYPKIERFASLSVAPKDVVTRLIGGEELVSMVGDSDHTYEKFYGYVSSFDWSKTDMKLLEEGLRFNDHETYCYFGDGEKHSVQSRISYPKDFVRYWEPPSCLYSIAVTATLKSNLFSLLLAIHLLYFILR